MTSVNFLIDQYMIDHNEQDLLKILTNEGYNVKVGAFERLSSLKNGIPKYYTPYDCVITYGSLEFVTQQNQWGYIPGGYLQEKNLLCTSYLPRIPQHLLLNEQHVFATFGDFVRRYEFFYHAFQTHQLFIRPNTGKKLFTGLVLNKDDFMQEINALKQLSGVDEDTLILVAPARSIENEYRLCIINREVVTGSQYLAKGEVALDTFIPEEVLDVGRKMAEIKWQPDIAYVCDVATTPDTPKIVELNALSCSGLYLCDIPKLAKAWKTAALSEFDGDLTLGDF